MATPKVSSFTTTFWTNGLQTTATGIKTVTDVAPPEPSKPSATSPTTSATVSAGAPPAPNTPSATSPTSSTGPPVSTPTNGTASSSVTIHPNTSNSSNSTLIQPTSTVAPSTSSSGISAGAVTGIAIGCAIFGLLAGLLAACVILRRKKGQNDEANTVMIHHEPKAHTSETTTIPSLATGIQLGQFLLEAISERDIAQEVQSLGELIQQHVGNHYHLKPVNTDIQGLAAALARLGFSGSSSSIDAHGIAALCMDTTTRQSGIQHVIMRTTFKSIDLHSQSDLPSLLPRPIATFLQALPSTEHYRSADSEATSLAMRKWRNLSAFLLHPNRSHRTSLPMDEAMVGLEAHELVNCLNIFLHNFVEPNPAVVQEQASHLEAVIMECAKLGHVLISQPADWGLVIDATSTAGGPQIVVVEPGLEKLSDQDGSGYPLPRVVVEPVVVACHTGQ